MPRRIPFSLRQSFAAPATGDNPIVLVTLSGGALLSPLLVASDWTDVLSRDPLTYGVIRGGVTYGFVLTNIELPDEQEDSPGSSKIVFENVSSDMVTALRAATSMIDVEMRLVHAGDVNANIDPWLLKCEHGGYDASTVALDVARDDDNSEPASMSASKTRFPGQFR